MTTQTPKWRRWRWWAAVIGIFVVAFIALGFVLEATGYKPKDDGTAAASTTTTTTTKAAAPVPAGTTLRAPVSASTSEPPLTDFTPTPVDTATECATFSYGHAASGIGTAVFLNEIPDDGPFRIVIHRSTGGDRVSAKSSRFPGASVIEADYPDIDYSTVTGVEVSDIGKTPCSISLHD